MQRTEQASSGPDRSALAVLLREHLAQNELTIREAARLADVPTSTLHRLLYAEPGNTQPATRAALVRLGLPRSAVEYAAALTAGYDVRPVTLSAREAVLVGELREHPADVVDALLVFVRRVRAASKRPVRR